MMAQLCPFSFLPRPIKYDDKIIAQIFLSDSLENGAGYSNYPSKDKNFDEVLKSIIENEEFKNVFLNEEHTKNCDSSCYACMQDYFNLHYHGLLDWRLGYDMVQMMRNKDFVPNLSQTYWKSISKKALKNLKEFIETTTEDQNLSIEGNRIMGNNRIYELIHPLSDKKLAGI